MLSALRAPPPAIPGSTVAVICPSAPAVALWPHRVSAGTRFLERSGYQIRIMPNAGLQTGWTAGTGEQRAEDLNAAFEDPDVSVVLAAIGGNHSAQMLPFVDFDLIAQNPKIVQGYSDTTVLLWAVAKHAGLRTFHGPALVSELGEYLEPLPYTATWLQSAWTDSWSDITPSDVWTDEFLDWDQRADLERPRNLKRGNGWHCIRSGRADGPLLGGCLETIIWHLAGTPEWIQPEGAILFLETSEEAPSPAHIDAYLTTLARIGAFDSAAGLLFGRPYGYTDADKQQLFEVVERRTAASGIPVLADVDIGHADPMLTLPIGAPARLDAGAKKLSIGS